MPPRLRPTPRLLTPAGWTALAAVALLAAAMVTVVTRA
ncbi:hypothetical protein E1H18_1117 [Caulobacter sp. RHG1]|jgi:hypothetical protein|nr:hypothetical protein [Caulobacter sp. RHG1]